MIELQRTYILERLITTLNRVLQKRFTFITAPAGYGKTTLVDQWSLLSDLPFIWMEMTESYNDTEVLHMNLTRIIEKANSKKAVIILDHVHLLHNTKTITELKKWMLKASSNINFIILSRESISPIKHVSDIQYQTFQLDAKDLKFTREETVAWISNQTAYFEELSGKQLDDLFQITDGCPALLHISYQHYLRDDIPLIDEQGRVAPLLEEYVVKEWIGRIPKNVLVHMQPLTIPPYLSLDFAKDLVQIDINPLFEVLEHHLLLNKIFVKNRWMHCFHPLVRAIINERLPETKFERQTYEKIALFLDNEGFQQEAIEMAIQARKSKLALLYIKDSAPNALRHQDYNTLQNWFNRLDPMHVSQDEDATSLYQWVLTMLNTPVEIQEDPKIKNIVLETKKDKWTPFISLNKGSIPFVRNQFGFKGDINDTIKEQNVSRGENLAFSPYRELALSEAFYEQNNIIAARTHLETLWHSTETNNNPGLSIPGLWMELLCNQLEGRLTKVHYFTEEIFYRSLQTSIPVWRRVGKAIRTYTLLKEGFLDDAEDWLAEQKEFLPILWNQLTSFEYFTFARTLLAFQETEEADNLLRRMVTSKSIENNKGTHLERRLLQTITAIKLGHQKEAQIFLKEALETGHSYGYKRIFLDQDPTLFIIFPDIKKELPSDLQLYTNELLQLLKKEELKEVKDNPKVKDALTLHEIEIIKYIRQGFSNRLIGEQMHITEGTVKGHLHRIYKKLNVNNRVQAVKIAENQLLL